MGPSHGDRSSLNWNEELNDRVPGAVEPMESQFPTGGMELTRLMRRSAAGHIARSTATRWYRDVLGATASHPANTRVRRLVRSCCSFDSVTFACCCS